MKATTALLQAIDQFPYGPESCRMDAMIRYMEEDGSDLSELGFSKADVHLQIAMESMQLTQNEKDLLYMKEFFKYAWTTLHRDLVVGGRKPTSYEKGIIRNMYTVMSRLGCLTVFMDGGADYKLSNQEFDDIIYTDQ